MLLYCMPGSCALSRHIALEWAGATYAAERLSQEDLSGEAFLAVNPKAKVPALQRDGSLVVTEALAILVHLANEHAGAGGLLPETASDRARMLEALSEMTGEFHPAFFPIHVPDRYTTEAAGHDAVQAAARKRVRAHYNRWEGRLEGKTWVLGETRSIVAPYLYVMGRWAGIIGAQIEDWPALARFQGQMDDDLGVRRALAAEGLT